VDFFKDVFPDYKVQYVTAAVNMSTLLLFTFINMCLSNYSTTENRMRISGYLLAAFLVIVPLMNEFLIVPIANAPTDDSKLPVLFAVLILAEVAAAATNAVFQSSLYGMAGEMQVDGDLMGRSEVGKGIAGIGVLVLRALTKAVFPETHTGMAHSGTAFFLAAVFLAGASMILFDRMMAKRRRLASAKADPEAGQEAKVEATETTALLGDRKEAVAEEDLESHSWAVHIEVFRAVKNCAFTTMVAFIVCLACFPGLTSSLQSTSWNLGSWFPLVLISLYNIGDLVGKTSPTIKMCLRADNVHMPAIFMVIFFVPAFLSCLFFQLHDLVPCILVIALGAMTGYVTTSAMMLGPAQVPPNRRDTAGQLCALFLISGLCFGSLIGMGISHMHVTPLARG